MDTVMVDNRFERTCGVTLASGDRVVVKVQRPTARETIEQDLAPGSESQKIGQERCLIRHPPDDELVEPASPELIVTKPLPPRPLVRGCGVYPGFPRGRRLLARCWRLSGRPMARGDIFPVIWTQSSLEFDATHDNRMLYAVDVTGGGRNCAMSRKMSAKRIFGMATSAI
jgi:hypothetical protein